MSYYTHRHVSGKDVLAFLVWTAAAMLVGAAIYARYFPPKPPEYRIVREYSMPILGWGRLECIRVCTAQERSAKVHGKERY